MVETPPRGWDNSPGESLKRHSLRSDANFVGAVCLTQNVLLQVIFLVIIFGMNLLGLVNLRDAYYGLGNTGFLVLYASAYVIGMALPAPIIARITHRRVHPFSAYEGGREARPSGMVMGAMAGMVVCIAANYAASWVAYLFSQAGLYPPETPDYLEKTVPSLLMNVLVMAVLPAVFEEMVYRGYVLRTLRSFGDTTAVVASSLLFALMHGNILQIPFALLVGLACGVLAVRTGRVWPSMLLHFLNNFMSVLLQYANFYIPDTASSQRMIAVTFAVVGMVALASVIGLYATNQPLIRREQAPPHPVPGKERARALLLSPAVIATVALLAALTVYTTRSGGLS